MSKSSCTLLHMPCRQWCVHVCAHRTRGVCMCVHAVVCVYVYTQWCVCMCMCVCDCACVCMCVRACMSYHRSCPQHVCYFGYLYRLTHTRHTHFSCASPLPTVIDRRRLNLVTATIKKLQSSPCSPPNHLKPL